MVVVPNPKLGQHASLLIGVTSNDTNVGRRQLLRRTWLPHCQTLAGCDAFFLLRKPAIDEAERYSADIIVLDPVRELEVETKPMLVRTRVLDFGGHQHNGHSTCAAQLLHD